MQNTINHEMTLKMRTISKSRETINYETQINKQLNNTINYKT